MSLFLESDDGTDDDDSHAFCYGDSKKIYLMAYTKFTDNDVASDDGGGVRHI